MKLETIQKIGGISLMAGALCLAGYSVLFSIALPVARIRQDITLAVMTPYWIPIVSIAFAGVVLMMGGFAAIYSRLWDRAGTLGLLGFICIQAAYLLQACKVTWEIFLYPVITAHQGAAALLREGIILHDPLVMVFRAAAMGTIISGILLFCYAIYRSGMFSRLGAVLVFSGALAYGLGPMLSIYAAIAGISVFALGCLILGRDLIRGPSLVPGRIKQ